MEKEDKDSERRDLSQADVTSSKRYRKVEVPAGTDSANISECIVCSEAAHLQCMHCELSVYCNLQHMRMDTVHPKVCSHLAFLNRKQQLFPQKEDREQQIEQNKSQKVSLAAKLREMAFQLRLEDDEQQAKVAFRYSHKIYSSVTGPNSDNTLDTLLLIASSCITLQQYQEAEACLSEVNKYITDSSSSFSVKADLEKMLGLMDVANGKTVDALSHFTKEVYFAAHAYGKRHVLASGSLRRLGSCFLQMGKSSVADSLYRKAAEIWVEYLEKKVLEHETVEMQARLVDVVHLKTEAIDHRVKVEGKETLPVIYKDRKFAKVPTMRNNLVITCYANGMFAFVLERYVQAYNFVLEALQSCKKTCKPELKTAVTNFYKLCKRKVTRDEVKPTGALDISKGV